MRGQKILLVEPEKTQKYCLSRLLTNIGYHVSSAEGMGDAIPLTEAIEPDIILIDAKLSDGDGYTLCQKITGVHRNFNVVMMCEYSRAFEMEKARAMGARACVAKPFSFSSLQKKLAKLEG